MSGSLEKRQTGPRTSLNSFKTHSQLTTDPRPTSHVPPNFQSYRSTSSTWSLCSTRSSRSSIMQLRTSSELEGDIYLRIELICSAPINETVHPLRCVICGVWAMAGKKYCVARKFRDREHHRLPKDQNGPPPPTAPTK